MIFLLAFLAAKAQNFTSTVFQTCQINHPLAMINHNSYSQLIYVNLDYRYTGHESSLSIVGVDKSGNVIYRKTVPKAWGLGRDYYTISSLKKALPGKNKGLLLLVSPVYCEDYNTSSSNYSNRIILFDSLGTIQNPNSFTLANTYSDIGVVNSNFYFIAQSNHLDRISNYDGALQNTFFTISDNIEFVSSKENNRIIVKSIQSLYIIDTVGTIYKQKNVSEKYTKLLSGNNAIYAYSAADNLIHKLDTNLNVVKTLTLSSNNYTLKDLRYHADTLYLCLFDKSSYFSVLRSYDTSLTIASSKTIDIADHEVINYNKQDKTYILSTENPPKGNQSLGFFQLNTLSDYSFNHDLILSNIKYVSLDSIITISPYKKQFIYTTEVTVRNNGTDQVNKLRIIDKNANESIYGNSRICSDTRTTMYMNDITVNIPPQGITKFQIQSMTQIWDTREIPDYAIINVCYMVSLPNNCFEQNLKNSYACKSLTVGAMPIIPKLPLESFNLYPNPTKQFLNLPWINVAPTAATMLHNKNVVIRDMLGQVVLETEARTNIDVSFLSNGVYFISYEFMGEIRDEKFIKLD